MKDEIKKKKRVRVCVFTLFKKCPVQNRNLSLDLLSIQAPIEDSLQLVLEQGWDRSVHNTFSFN